MNSARYLPAGHLCLRLPGRRSLLLHRRSLVVSGVLTVAALTIAAVTLTTGAYHLSSAGAVRTLFGAGSPTDHFIVVDQRLPRIVAALLVGVALGGSGAIFQSLSRNPLGSPDVIGFTTGAATGGLVVILLAGASTASPIILGTVAGGAASALLVVVLALHRGMVGDRLVLGGVAVAAMLSAVNDYLLSRAPIEAAEAAKAWQYGSLNAIGWGPVRPLVLALVVVVPAALLASRTLRMLEMGDDLAAGTGVGLLRTRMVALVLGVCLAATAVATAGPIGFLALAAPQLARRISRSPGVALLPAMTMGAVILAAGDLLAQRLLSPFQLPVGLVTGALGGAYLLWLLTYRDDRSRARG